MWNELFNNLINTGFAMLIFLCSYLANMAFSLWYNIKILNQDFDKEKIYSSGLKILVFVVGLTLLCIAITTLPIFANQIGWEIPEEYADIFANIVIIAAVLLVSSKYIKEAYSKFVAILNTSNDIIKVDTPMEVAEQQEKTEEKNNRATDESQPQTVANAG